jgi:transposase
MFASQGQETFIEGHLEPFRVLGGVPTDKIRYDNLRSAVSRVLFRSHYGFDAFYCQPGIAGAHEKGGVEGEVGRFRRNHLVPVHTVDTLAELNARIEVADLADEGRRIDGRSAPSARTSRWTPRRCDRCRRRRSSGDCG